MVESRDRGPDPGDRALLEWAASEGRVLVTMDKDFGEFIFTERLPHCGLIRLPNVPAERRIVLMERVLSEHGDELSAHAVVTVRGGRIRISRSP